MRFLVFQHIAIEHPGSFREFMDEDGIEWDAVALDEGGTIPALAGYDALIVMGGPMDVWQEEAHPWLAAEKAAIREAVAERRMPYLGVCLGHQLLADALGGEVGPMSASEVGLSDIHLTPRATDDPLFSGLPETATTLQWHSAEVRRAPAGSVVLASSPLCAVQAFRTGGNAYGIQYHMEMTERTVPEWGRVAEYAGALERTLGAGALQSMEREVAARLGEFRANARRLYRNFLAVVSSA